MRSLKSNIRWMRHRPPLVDVQTPRVADDKPTPPQSDLCMISKHPSSKCKNTLLKYVLSPDPRLRPQVHLRIKHRPKGWNSPRRKLINNLPRKPWPTNHKNRLRPPLTRHIPRQLHHILPAMPIRVDNDRVRVSRGHHIQHAISISLARLFADQSIRNGGRCAHTSRDMQGPIPLPVVTSSTFRKSSAAQPKPVPGIARTHSWLG